MNVNKKPTGAGGLETDAPGAANIYPDFTTIPDPIQQLINQADRRMESDPARYGSHFLIWLSLRALKNGLPWPGGDNA